MDKSRIIWTLWRKKYWIKILWGMFIQYFFLHRVSVTGIPKIILDKQKLCSKLHMTQFTCIVFFVIHHHRFKKNKQKKQAYRLLWRLGITWKSLSLDWTLFKTSGLNWRGHSTCTKWTVWKPLKCSPTWLDITGRCSVLLFFPGKVAPIVDVPIILKAVFCRRHYAA